MRGESSEGIHNSSIGLPVNQAVSSHQVLAVLGSRSVPTSVHSNGASLRHLGMLQALHALRHIRVTHHLAFWCRAVLEPSV